MNKTKVNASLSLLRYSFVSLPLLDVWWKKGNELMVLFIDL